MSTRRGRRRVADHSSGGHDGPDERWMASYLDMVTVLMCLFIVLFAMSSVDQEKFDALRNSLATGFGQETSEIVDLSDGVVVPPELLEEEGEGFTQAAAIAELDSLTALRDRLRAALEERGLQDAATFSIDERGLTIGLIGAETFFETNSTELSPMAGEVLNALGGVLAGAENQISVEGHADHRSPAAPFPTNWELSAGRATQVLRHLVEVTHVAGERVRSVGFGSTRPSAPGDAPEQLALNRRVDIVVLSDAAEEVRDLIPALSSAGGGH